MKKYIRETVPEREVDRLAAVVCDLCGIQVKYGNWSDRPDDINAFEETTISFKDGNWSAEDGGHTTVVSYDVCPECFRTRLMSWFAAHGAKPTVAVDEW